MPRLNEVPSQAVLLEFSEVYLRAVALSWGDNDISVAFRQLFIESPKQALIDYFGYIVPWNIDLVISPCDPSQGWNGREWLLPPNRMTFSIPETPALEEQAIALAAYNDAGPIYLFTCC
ncbi:BMA_0021/BMA_0022 family TOMM bacteriocin [Pseudomonas sp. MF4836]|uniref:BMA_0021/BMA_0022 family TOMM bacteriocin n=1 Tax=Pseudomonas sp. MF4836 TaxID=1960827 RepID=UPI00099746B8|nr:BMA_0021/BMA_0022 family TOMM bacteriocin [Pseudomonas sp. MF4836]OOV94735.1 hypothetical protein MF4836_18345 [Pseudomonas sp. MF4836]